MEIKKRLMAIDYGSRRIGVAVSDAFHLTARPLKAIDQKQESDIFDRIQRLIEENEIEELADPNDPYPLFHKSSINLIGKELVIDRGKAFRLIQTLFPDEQYIS